MTITSAQLINVDYHRGLTLQKLSGLLKIKIFDNVDDVVNIVREEKCKYNIIFYKNEIFSCNIFQSVATARIKHVEWKKISN